MCILFKKLLHTSLGKTHTRRERERERERALLGKLLVLILEHFSHGFCFTFQKKAAYFLRNYCIFFQESRYSKREIESEGDLLEKLLVLTLVHTSHGFCFYFSWEMCILSKGFLHSSLRKKPYSKRERERERERELLEKLLVLILLHFSHGFCHTFQETCAYFLKDYGALFQEKPIEGDLLDKLLVLILAYFSHGFCPTFQKKTAYLLRNYCIFSRKTDTRRER